jgi:hypothetical protein
VEELLSDREKKSTCDGGDAGDHELIYKSGHRQIWREVKMEGSERRFYECLTFCPEGRPLEFKVHSSGQLKRIIRRVRRSGGQVRKLTHQDD